MSDTVDKLITLAEAQAHNVLLVLRQSLMPSWVIVAEDGQPHIKATPWRDDREKELARAFIGRELRKYKARAYSFVTEAWTAAAPAGWDPKTPLPEQERPVHRTDRNEVVIAFASDGRENLYRSWLIRRDWNEQIVTLELIADKDVDQMEGWIIDLAKLLK